MKDVYSLRKDFTIIGLTGILGSGCSNIASLLSNDVNDFYNNKNMRDPQSLKLLDDSNDPIYDNILFYRKYQMCHQYMKMNWTKFLFIDYKKVLFLYCFYYYALKENEGDFNTRFSIFISKNFTKAPKSDKDSFDDSNKNITTEEVQHLFSENKPKLDKLIKDIQLIGSENDDLLNIKDESKLHILYTQFFVGVSEFNSLFKEFLKLFDSKNYYLRALFFHKIGCAIRNTGNPQDLYHGETHNVYNIARLINRLIKSFRNEDENKGKCHIVINSLKNSLEIMYFKERYSAFYMMAVHFEKDRERVLEEVVKDENYKKETINKLLELDNAEYRTKDFKKGLFSSPDIENCIQKSDIHIIFNNYVDKLSELPASFTTVKEQLIKYLALINQPGIITPSNIERCMQIAFNSKLNSGCISRQVGAVITNEGYAVKSIGWNDTQKKQFHVY